MEAVLPRQPVFLHPRDGPHDLHDGDGEPHGGRAEGGEPDQRRTGSTSVLDVPGAPDPSRALGYEFAFLLALRPCTGERKEGAPHAHISLEGAKSGCQGVAGLYTPPPSNPGCPVRQQCMPRSSSALGWRKGVVQQK